ncbi:MAG: DUF4012 domain-containing protein [Anaerolineae bacterium]|nr:DUF4012 domain-containing protein [Anaerolineae bacterium]
MRLTTDQLRSLARLLEPQFQTVEQRRHMLRLAFEDRPGVTRGINLGAATPEQFALNLLGHLQGLDASAENGNAHSALGQLLDTVVEQTTGDGSGLAEALLVYRARLDMPEPLQPFDEADDETTAPHLPASLDDTLPTPAAERSGQSKAVAASAGPSGVTTGVVAAGGAPGGSGARAGEPARSHPRRRRKRGPLKRLWRRVRRVVKWQIVAVALIILITVPTVVTIAILSDTVARVQESLGSLERVTGQLGRQSLANLTLDDYARLQFGVRDLARSLSGARQQVSLLRPFAGMNADLRAGIKALSAAELVAGAANDILEGLQPTVFTLVGGASQQTVGSQLTAGGNIVERLQLGRGNFLNANNRLAQAQALIDDIDLTGVSPALLLNLNKLEQYYADIRNLNDILVDADQLIARAFGLDNNGQNYLILSQNSDELRPSGGYLSTYGWLRVRQGRIVDFGYSPTTTLSPNPPPTSLVSELDIPAWWIQYANPIYTAWDGSWYADFPSTARMAAWYFDNGNNPRSPVDGVMAIDIVGFEYILRGLGSVTVPGYNEVVTPEDFRDVVYRIRAEGEGDVPHKRFLAALYRQILEDWQRIDEERGDEMLNSVLQALREKHIMLYFTESRLNEIVRLLGWSGAQVNSPGHDYLMVADANMGNKSNRSIIREITYDVELQTDGTTRSRATIAYEYSSRLAEGDPAVRPEHYAQIDYFNTMQVYVPLGSTLTRASNFEGEVHTDVVNELTTFVSLIKVPFDTLDRFQLTYNTPPIVQQIGSYRRYALLVQKQPGMLDERVNVTVTLPAGVTVVSTSPSPVASYNLGSQILEFRLTLDTDQWVEIIYE